MIAHHARSSKTTLLYLPPLVPSRSARGIASTSLSKRGLSGCPSCPNAAELAGEPMQHEKFSTVSVCLRVLPHCHLPSPNSLLDPSSNRSERRSNTVAALCL